MPTLRQLTYLVAVADERHFGHAAERVNVAQPTLSVQFAELERKLGTRLVERGRSGVSVTPLGRELVERARKVLSDTQEIVDLAASAKHGLAGKLKLGVPPTLGPYLLPYVVPELHRRYPFLKLYVKEGTPREIQNSLLSGDLDLVLTPMPVEHRALEVQSLFREHLRVVCAPDHPLAKHDKISLKDLKDQKVLTLASGHHLHSQVRGICDSYGADLLYDYEGTSLDTLRHMVGMGVGISFFPELYILSEMHSDKELKVLHLDDADLSREISMAWRSRSMVGKQNLEMAALVQRAFEARYATVLSA